MATECLNNFSFYFHDKVAQLVNYQQSALVLHIRSANPWKESQPKLISDAEFKAYYVHHY